MTKSEAQLKCLEMHRRLTEFYGKLELISRREPMHELISTMLSHRTTEANEAKAYARMMETFRDYEGVLNAPFDALADSLNGTQFPGQKAANIKKVLQLIKEHPENNGKFSIGFLKKLPAPEAMEWLTALPGVGLKTATLLLLFNFKKPVLPVDTHVFRVSQRVGVLTATDTPEKAHKILPGLLPEDAAELYNFHIHLLRHGQKICTWRKPKHELCVLKDICNYCQDVANADVKM